MDIRDITVIRGIRDALKISSLIREIKIEAFF